MLNRLLTRETWAQNVNAVSEHGIEVSWDSDLASRRDLTSWLKYMYCKQEDLDSAIEKLRSVINTDPVLMGVDVDREKFDIGNRKVPLWCWNDSADWQHVSRLLALVNIE